MASFPYQSNLCPEIASPNNQLMLLQTIDDYLKDEEKRVGMANTSIVMRNICNLPFQPVSVIRTYINHSRRPEVIAWCEESLSANCRIEFQNFKIYFELEEDALMFVLRWSDEDVCHPAT
jgi:hypothetical protein